ncbi:MAG TPA: hypothetical protein VK826_20270 [Bacteroidia bacterium]|nr:hypothetical protein [Bacteroidia bacterium]
MKQDKMREAVHNYIDQVDESILKMIHAMLKEYNAIVPLSPDNEAMLEKRYKEYKMGKGKSYTVEEAKVELRRRIKKK